MLSLTHTLVSLPFALYLTNPILIFLAAFVFHFVCDTLLHWNIYPDKFKHYPFALVAADIITGLILTWLIFHELTFSVPIIAAIAGGNTPDILQGLWDLLPNKTKDRYFNWAKPTFRWHHNLQFETDNFWTGIISQVVLILLAICLMFFWLFGGAMLFS